MLTGKLILRNPGASGLGREVLLALHPAWLEKQTEKAPGATPRPPGARKPLWRKSCKLHSGRRGALPLSVIGARAPRGAVLSVDLSQGGRAPW